MPALLLLVLDASDLFRGHGAILGFLFIAGGLFWYVFSVESGGVGSIRKPEPAPHRELLRVSSLMTSLPCLLLAIAGSRLKVTVVPDGSTVSLKSLLMSGYEGSGFRVEPDFPTPVADLPFFEGRLGPCEALVAFIEMSTMSSGLPPVDRARGLGLSMDIGLLVVGLEVTWFRPTSEMVMPL